MATVWILVPMVVVVSTLVITQAAQPDFCNLPSETGPCRAAFRRYFFDSSAQECKLFIYGGCQGNDNNFRSESQCRAACTCTQNSDSGQRCRRPVQRFYYDVSDATCKRFQYNGCGGNSNRFFRVRQCLDACATSLCFLPPETGPCRAAFNRYYYNKTSQSCEVFTYGGCQGNENRFITQEECNRKCAVPISGEEAIFSRTAREAPEPPVTNEPTGPPMSSCKLPQATGPCRAAFPRYFYNSTSKSCEFFVYGGCQGNENNFATEVECQRRCISNTGDQQRNEASHGLGTLTAEDCQLPPDQGLCQAYEQAFYYNGATGKCEEFIYGGCQGNKNRFPTVQSCMKICGQFVSAETFSSIPGGGFSYIMRSVIPGGGLRMTEVKPQLCTLNMFSLMADRVRAIFGLPSLTPKSPCDNYNPFPSQDLCHLPPEPGMCYGYFPKYHFNTETGKCEQFIYGGCGGNGNNFDSVSECEAKCGTVKPPPLKDQCFLPPESGICLGYFPKYHFNATSGACEEFIYGGCGGNDNNFDSAADCEKQCGVSGPPISNDRCLLPPETGLCKGYFPKYHFNATGGVCEEFIYGGCGGNDNRFDTAAECETKCGSAGPPVSNEQCLVPPETGLCRGYFPKYHFNVTSGACEEFIYGGCGGNNNRFDSVAECETKCGSAGPPVSNEQCLLPPETGLCRGYFPKYHFNVTSGACEQFIYGGCGGNNNRFDTVAECETKCRSVGPPLSNEQCLLPPETGMCRGYFPKYFFNATSGACEEFIYGGCQGNDNRFDSVVECQTKCGGN